MSKRSHLVMRLDKATETSNTKLMWTIINKHLHRKNPLILPDNDDKNELADKFNDFFIEKPLSLRSALMPGSQQGSETVTEVSVTLSSFRLLTVSEVGSIIKNSPRKSSILDPLPTWLLLKCLPHLLPAIHTIVNASLRDGMPRTFKSSLVVPLIKKKDLDKNVLTNYRPISNLSFLSKIIERAVYKQINDHLELNNLADPMQSAYRYYHSTESALLCVLDFVYSTCDNNQITLLVLLDMSAAFDTVDHDILSTQLQKCGITLQCHEWIMSYLSHRTQSININGVFSSSKPITCGVPQGSVLGPLLFSIYLIGLAEVIAPFGVNYILYADDLQLYIASKVSNLHESISRLEGCLIAVRTWLTNRLLVLNDTKTEMIVLGSKSNVKHCQNIKVAIGDHFVTPREYIRDLGVWLDPCLSFEHHVRKICARAYGQLRIVNRIKRSLPQHLYSTVVLSLVMSHINYCVTLLHGVSDKVIHKLQVVSNSALRSIEGHATCTSCPFKNSGLCHVNNIVYQVTCRSCSQIYIGSTIRPLHCRMSEHLRNTNSSIYKQIQTCVDSTRTTMEDKLCLHILSKENDPINLRIKEAILIREKCPQLNSREELKELKMLL
jgi:hypothetical protein